jgi:hypothetical protein
MNMPGFQSLSLRFNGIRRFEALTQQQMGEKVADLQRFPRNDDRAVMGLFRSGKKVSGEEPLGIGVLLDNVGLRHRDVYEADAESARNETYAGGISPEKRFMTAPLEELDEYVRTRQTELASVQENAAELQKRARTR